MRIWIRDPKSFLTWVRDEKFGSGINIPYPQHCCNKSMAADLYQKLSKYDTYLSIPKPYRIWLRDVTSALVSDRCGTGGIHVLWVRNLYFLDLTDPDPFIIKKK